MVAPIRVPAIERSRLFADALELALGRQDKILLLGAFSEPDEALALITKPAIDIVLVYAGSEETDTVRLVRHIESRHAEKGVIVMGIEDCEATILQYIEAGVRGYISKSASVADVAATIEAIHAGATQCTPRIIAAVFNRVKQPTSAVFPQTPKSSSTVAIRSACSCRCYFLPASAMEVALAAGCSDPAVLAAPITA